MNSSVNVEVVSLESINAIVCRGHDHNLPSDGDTSSHPLKVLLKEKGNKDGNAVTEDVRGNMENTDGDYFRFEKDLQFNQLERVFTHTSAEVLTIAVMIQEVRRKAECVDDGHDYVNYCEWDLDQLRLGAQTKFVLKKQAVCKKFNRNKEFLGCCVRDDNDYDYQSQIDTDDWVLEWLFEHNTAVTTKRDLTHLYATRFIEDLSLTAAPLTPTKNINDTYSITDLYRFYEQIQRLTFPLLYLDTDYVSQKAVAYLRDRPHPYTYTNLIDILKSIQHDDEDGRRGHLVSGVAAKKMIVVGDIHGDVHILIAYLRQWATCPEKILDGDTWKLNTDYIILFTGDLVDRGIYGLDVMCIVYTLLSKNDGHVFVTRGNHDDDPGQWENYEIPFTFQLKWGGLEKYAQIDSLSKLIQCKIPLFYVLDIYDHVDETTPLRIIGCHGMPNVVDLHQIKEKLEALETLETLEDDEDEMVPMAPGYFEQSVTEATTSPNTTSSLELMHVRDGHASASQMQTPTQTPTPLQLMRVRHGEASASTRPHLPTGRASASTRPHLPQFLLVSWGQLDTDEKDRLAGLYALRAGEGTSIYVNVKENAISEADAPTVWYDTSRWVLGKNHGEAEYEYNTKQQDGSHLPQHGNHLPPISGRFKKPEDVGMANIVRKMKSTKQKIKNTKLHLKMTPVKNIKLSFSSTKKINLKCQFYRDVIEHFAGIYKPAGTGFFTKTWRSKYGTIYYDMLYRPKLQKYKIFVTFHTSMGINKSHTFSLEFGDTSNTYIPPFSTGEGGMGVTISAHISTYDHSFKDMYYPRDADCGDHNLPFKMVVEEEEEEEEDGRDAPATKAEQSEEKDYYKILQELVSVQGKVHSGGPQKINKDSSADTIKRVYKGLARVYHLDESKTLTDEEKELARDWRTQGDVSREDLFQKIGGIYEVLRNETKKTEYDNGLATSTEDLPAAERAAAAAEQEEGERAKQETEANANAAWKGIRVQFESNLRKAESALQTACNFENAQRASELAQQYVHIVDSNLTSEKSDVAAAKKKAELLAKLAYGVFEIVEEHVPWKDLDSVHHQLVEINNGYERMVYPQLQVKTALEKEADAKIQWDKLDYWERELVSPEFEFNVNDKVECECRMPQSPEGGEEWQLATVVDVPKEDDDQYRIKLEDGGSDMNMALASLRPRLSSSEKRETYFVDKMNEYNTLLHKLQWNMRVLDENDPPEWRAVIARRYNERTGIISFEYEKINYNMELNFEYMILESREDKNSDSERIFNDLLVEQINFIEMKTQEQALRDAAMDGNEARVNELLASTRRINVNAQDNLQRTPLILAAAFGRINVVKTLLKAGADSRIKDKFGLIALQWAQSKFETDTAVEIKSKKDVEGVLVQHVQLSRVKFRYASLSQRGHYPENPNKANQDAFFCAPNFNDDPDGAFFGVFDGHGAQGDLCAQYARDKVQSLLAEYRNAAKGEDGAQPEWSDAHITKAFVEANKALHEYAYADDSMSGTTAVTVYVRDGGTLVVANAGDSRIIIVSKDPGSGKLSARPLSIDQTPFRKDERERCKRSGARVMTMDQLDGLEPIHENWGLNLGEEIDDIGDPPRIWHPHGQYPGCAFTRSIGDQVSEALGVYAEPEIESHVLQPGDQYVIIASDGVWEFLTSQAVADLVAKYDDPLDACRAVVAKSYDLWMATEERTDDITMIALFLDDVKPVKPALGGGHCSRRHVRERMRRSMRARRSRRRGRRRRRTRRAPPPFPPRLKRQTKEDS